MSKEIWLGPLLGNNRSRLIQRCSELVAAGRSDSFLYLAASHPLLEVVTQGVLDGVNNRGVWGELPVYLFRGLVRRLLSSAVNEHGQKLPPRIPIDQDELPLKRSLISQILTRLLTSGQLKAIGPLANREGCVNTIATLIGEIERAAKSPAEVAEIIAERVSDLAPEEDERQRSEPSGKARKSGRDARDPSRDARDPSRDARGLGEGGLASQIDFDREVALIYATYTSLLDQHQLTEQDADQLRAFRVLSGELDGHALEVPWLNDVQLLVLDGFFDFTPVQGEILRQLIPCVPEVVVNLNHDQRNPEIFLPFQETIGHLNAIAPFVEIRNTDEVVPAAGALSALRQNLFNPTLSEASSSDKLQFAAVFQEDSKQIGNRHDEHPIGAAPMATPLVCAPGEEPQIGQSEIRYFECGDRDTEIRAVAKEIKRLVRHEGYSLADIALVVRQRAAYAETIVRVMREESLPCNIEARIEANDIPANRAALKLFAILEELSRAQSVATGQDQDASEHAAEYKVAPRISELADLVKSEYFRLRDDDLSELSARFDAEFAGLLVENDRAPDAEQTARLKNRYRIGSWDADALENAFAYVGSELRVSDWLARARKLIKELPGAAATRELLNIDAVEQARDPDEADQIENAETAKVEAADAERKRRPSRDIHPAALAWTALVVQTFAERIQAVERTGTPARLRQSLLKLLEQFSFRDQITRPVRRAVADEELPQVMLNYNSLEALRRAFLAAIKSIEIAATMSEPPALADGKSTTAQRKTKPGPLADAGSSDKTGSCETTLATFVEEVRRSLSSQSVVFGAAYPQGLRVLEATDVRGLRFRVVFIAGLVEGGFPLRASRDWIYPHEERERLKRYGLTLEDISPATLLKEEHYFYQAACRATEHLYLSRPLALADDSETVASYYLDELRRAVSPLPIHAETVRRDYEGRKLEQVSTAAELNVALVRQQERHAHRGEKRELLPQPRLKRLLTLARNDGLLSSSALRRIEIERERAGPRFGPYDGEITNPHLLGLLSKRFGIDFVHSASGLSVYGNCAYRFFGQRVLKLEPRGEAALDLQAIDAGKLLHDILRRFFERHRRQRLTEFDRESLQQELRELADRVFDEHERVVPPLNKQIWKIDREIRKILLDQVLLYELEIQEQAAAAGVVPAYFEVAFGGMKSAARDPESTDRPLELTRATFVGEESIKVSGQIDRVDVAADQTLIAYDYKLSTGSTKEDIKAGRSLQLPIYLEALERLLFPEQPIAGGGYYVIRGGNERRNRGLHRASQLHYSGISNRVLGVMSDDEWQQIRDDVIAKIWNFLDHMRAGEFGVNPSEKQKTCRFCDFAAVCRYDRYRIDAKRQSADDTDSAD